MGDNIARHVLSSFEIDYKAVEEAGLDKNLIVNLIFLDPQILCNKIMQTEPGDTFEKHCLEVFGIDIKLVEKARIDPKFLVYLAYMDPIVPQYPGLLIVAAEKWHKMKIIEAQKDAYQQGRDSLLYQNRMRNIPVIVPRRAGCLPALGRAQFSSWPGCERERGIARPYERARNCLALPGSGRGPGIVWPARMRRQGLAWPGYERQQEITWSNCEREGGIVEREQEIAWYGRERAALPRSLSQPGGALMQLTRLVEETGRIPFNYQCNIFN